MDINYRDMVPYYHKHGPEACGGIAFYVNRLVVVVDQPLVNVDIELSDGSHPDLESMPACEECGGGVLLTMGGFRWGHKKPPRNQEGRRGPC